MRVEDQVEVAVRKDDAAPEEGVRFRPRDALEALDEGLVDEGDAELGEVKGGVGGSGAWEEKKKR